MVEFLLGDPRRALQAEELVEHPPHLLPVQQQVLVDVVRAEQRVPTPGMISCLLIRTRARIQEECRTKGKIGRGVYRCESSSAVGGGAFIMETFCRTLRARKTACTLVM